VAGEGDPVILTVMRTAATAACAASIALAGAAPAGAEAVPPGEEGALADILPPVHEAKVCFARTYDAAHLRRHPRQKVTGLLFQVRYYRHEPAPEFPQGQRNYYFDMAAKVKGHRKTLRTSGECMIRDGTIWCGVECDGGAVIVRREAKSGGIRMSFPGEHWYIRMTDGCDSDEENAVNLKPGADDKVFLLDKAEPAACRELNEK
jgi:hypothetical protein